MRYCAVKRDVSVVNLHPNDASEMPHRPDVLAVAKHR